MQKVEPKPSLPRIAITMGDAAGVGPELCVRALASEEVRRICQPIVYGDLPVLQAAAAVLRLPLPAQDVLDVQGLKPNDFAPGRISAAAGAASHAYLKAAIADALDRRVDAICTAPINKESLHAGGINHPGHTEILAELTAAPRVCMMLTSDEITCSLVTAHVGLRDVPELLSVPRILDAIELTAHTMRRLRRREPRLTVCGLNPHAGEHGLFGRREEELIITPAIELARSQGIVVDGPLPPDTAFLPTRRRETDAYICMYHDQGLIPLKMLSFDTGVNVTLGLPIVRTSVDHGTAYDIAWRGQASATSMFAAIRLAAQLAS
jgi:4-hydroxythreonine-4-phosphate dehydrogenase